MSWVEAPGRAFRPIFEGSGLEAAGAYAGRPLGQ
jgi:hypothetical protein